ncbi:hypothetical protein E2C01_003482 [Portunus trituberculatus]|uniref:Uncharacterized protein n=1 Tax=Portunus trituberculatus TaxID=210409 RepID=A0A5B7CMF3_PORTR|nr:hypothetical protein [Portunus trituberculatus]
MQKNVVFLNTAARLGMRTGNWYTGILRREERKRPGSLCLQPCVWAINYQVLFLVLN